MQRVEATLSASVSDLRRNPTSVMNAAQSETVAIVSRDPIVAYVVPAEAYEAMLDRLDDFALVETAKARAGETGLPVDITELAG